MIHSAATVNWLQTYSELRKANVVGTENIVKFSFEEKEKLLVYISTLRYFHFFVILTLEPALRPIMNMI